MLRSGRTLSQFFGIVGLEHQLRDDRRLRLIGDVDDARELPRRQILLRMPLPSRAELLPPEPASSTWITYGLPLMMMLMTCCAPPPSSHTITLITLICGFGLARLDLARVEDHAGRCSAACPASSSAWRAPLARLAT